MSTGRPRGNPNIAQYAFKKGESFNSGGRRPLAKEVHDMLYVTADTHLRIISKQLQMTPDQLKTVLVQPNTTIQEHMVASLLLRSIAKADAFIYEKVMDRCIGKVALPVVGAKDLPAIRFVIEDAKSE